MNLRSKIRLIFTFFLTIISFCSYSQGNKFVVTLDAGHGDHDFGAHYHGRAEKNITLAIVLKIGKILEQQPNINVVYTRKTDVFIELGERGNIANRAKSNIFVSIHCNAAKNLSASGTETFVMGIDKAGKNLEVAKTENSVITLEKDYQKKYDGFDPNKPESMIGLTLMQEEFIEYSIALAGGIENEFGKLGKKLRGGSGVMQGPFFVLHRPYMPRVLVETGFISNKEEGAVLGSEEGQNDIAQAVANAIINYKREYFDAGSNDVDVRPIQKTPEKTVVKDTIPTVKVAEGVIFKVQLVASTKKLPLNPKNFKGLTPVSMVYESNIYKYTYQQTADYEKAKSYLADAKNKGYDSAFLVAFKNGQRINIQEAIK